MDEPQVDAKRKKAMGSSIRGRVRRVIPEAVPLVIRDLHGPPPGMEAVADNWHAVNTSKATRKSKKARGSSTNGRAKRIIPDEVSMTGPAIEEDDIKPYIAPAEVKGIGKDWIAITRHGKEFDFKFHKMKVSNSP
ncbi:unnamed protein product [Urochloa humidicola]